MSLPIVNSTLTIFVTLLLTTSLLSCGSEEQQSKNEIIRPAKIITVGDSLAGAKRTYPGEVEAGDRSEQAFRVSGELMTLPAKAGKKVKQGELLAQLDPTDYQLRVDEQQARFDLTQVQFIRTEKLVKQQLIPVSDFDKAKSNLLSATADLKLAKANLSYTKMLSPFDGIISKLNVKNHENIRKSEVILVVQTTDNVDITFNLSENIISKVKDRARDSAHPKVSFATHPDKLFTAKIKEFDAEADPQTRSYKITLTMPAPKDINALPGMSVSVHVDFSKILDNENNKLTIPIEAVFSPENDNIKSKTYMVWVVDSTSMKTKSTPVKIGQLNAQGIEILSGLQSGDQIITAGVNFIKEGQTVKPWIKEAGL